MGALQYVIDHWSEILNAATLLVTACAAIAALTPTPKDDAAVATLRKIVDALGLNWGHAKNRKK